MPPRPYMAPMLKNIGSGLAVGLAMYTVGVYATFGVFTMDGVLTTFGAMWATSGDAEGTT